MISRIFTLLIIVALVSCSSDDGFSDEKRELNQATQKWSNAQIQNYSIDERLGCFCGGLLEWEVYVKNGIKDKVEFDESKLSPGQTYNDVFQSSRTIEEAFDFIESLLNQEVASLVIEYDAIYGFPKLISIDYVENIADDEIVYLYTDLEIDN